MPYTLWSLGRQLGETDFGFLASEDRERRGWLIPTEAGEPLVEIAAGVSQAMEAVLDAFDIEEAAADIAAAVDRRDALALELHGPDNEPIPLERLTIRDTVVLMSRADARLQADTSWYESLTDEEREAFDAAIDDEVANEHATEQANDAHDLIDHEPPGVVYGLPRYEIVVILTDSASIPPRVPRDACR